MRKTQGRTQSRDGPAEAERGLAEGFGKRELDSRAGQVSLRSDLSPLETGLSADTGVSHSFYWPPKAYLSSEPLDEAVHKYLTVVKYKIKQKKYSTGTKSKPSVRGRRQKLRVSVKGPAETLVNCVIYFAE